MTLIFALLAIFGFASAAVVLVTRIFAPAAFFAWRERLGSTTLVLAAIAATIATLGSLYLSEVAHFPPCKLCWYQRIAMYPLSVILLVGALRREVRAAVQYAFVFPIVGSLIAIYHIYLEQNPSAQPSSCKVGGATCATKWIEKFGYITIPVLSITAFAAIFTLLVMAWSRRDAAAPQEPDSAVDPDAATARV